MKLLYNLDLDKTAELVNNKVILITGGTGSFGHKLVETLLNDFSPKKIIIFSRAHSGSNQLSQLLSNVTWNNEHTSVVSAAAFMTTWILKQSPNDSHITDGGSYVDPVAEAWEDEFIKALVDNTGYKVVNTKYAKTIYK